MGPVKLNLTSLALPKGSHSLSNHHPKYKIAYPGSRTITSVIHSLRPSQNMSAINKPLHAWEGGGWPPPPSLKSLWCGCNSASDLHLLGGLVIAQAIEIIWMAIGWIVWIWRASWKGCPSVIAHPPTKPLHLSDHELHHLCHLPHLHEMLSHVKTGVLFLWDLIAYTKFTG